MRKALLCIIFICIYCPVDAQTIIPRFESLGVNDGLPHSSVYSILQDKKGFMWFGTADGLCRYDGSQLVVYKYKSQYQNDVVNNVVRGNIVEDSLGNIYYCNESGIYKWERKTESVLRIGSLFSKFHKSYFILVSIDYNTVWMYDISIGVYAFDLRTLKQTVYNFPPYMSFDNIQGCLTKDDGHGSIWMRINASNEPYIIFNKLKGTFSVYSKKKSLHSCLFSNNYRIYDFDSSISYLNTTTNSRITISKKIDEKYIPFYSMAASIDYMGRLWMASRGQGLFCYDNKTGLLNQYHHDNSKLKSLPFDLTSCVYIDRNENLWVGMDGGGVARLDLKAPRFNLFPLSYGDHPVLTDYFTKSFYEDEKGRIWFGSQTSGLNIYNPEKNTLANYQITNKKYSLPGNMVGAIIKNGDGQMIMGSSGGISVFDEKHGTFRNIPIIDLPALRPQVRNFVNKLLSLKDGSILAATTMGIIPIRKEGSFYKGAFLKKGDNLSSVTTDIAETTDGTLYATLPDIGLIELQATSVGYTTRNKFLDGFDLRSVTTDDKYSGFLWIGSGKGLIHFNCSTHKYQLYDERDGMANSYVYGVLQDSIGGLWMSTNHGLSYYVPEENKFRNYTFEDGLQSNEFNTQAFYKSSSGTFYFGGIKGFNWFKSSSNVIGNIKPVAAITAIEVNDKPLLEDSSYSYEKTISLPYDKNYVAFHFAALDYTHPDANRIMYTLKNWDDGWVSTMTKSVRYANLSPGNYTFLLKVSNSSGVWSDEEKIHIIITPPYWKRTWFIIICTLAFVAVIAIATYKLSQIRSAKRVLLLEKQIAIDAERDRISADMHDEIGSSITHIALFSELIQTQHKSDNELKEDIRSIAVTARKLVQTMGDIIWALNPQNDTLEVLLMYIREQAQQYFDGMDITFRIEFPKEVPRIFLSNAVRRNLYLVTREGLNNAMKHSCSSEIILSLVKSKKNYCFRITDNGIGMHSVDRHGNGIRNLKKRMEDIGGTIEWINAEKGTIMEYCVDL